MRILLFLALSLTFVSCATYRAGGGYRTASDYSKGVDSADYSQDELQSARGHLERHSQYIPRAAFRLSWPVEHVRINRGFRTPEDAKHDGLDLGGRKGMPIMAAHEGVVIYTGKEFRGYGNMVMIEYNQEWATLYGHLNEIAAKEGQVVRPGDFIGTMGSTGHATGVHLHFEVMHNHAPTDPIPLLTRPEKFVSKLKGRKQAWR